MNDDWSMIADGLRQEIAEYGGLLGLYADQERALFERDADQVLRLSMAIERQVQVMQECRSHREKLVEEFAAAHSQTVSSTLRSLLPLFEPSVRPLFEALINEVNVLIHRLRRITRHNRTLLASAVESHQQLLQSLRPDVFAPTYSPSGQARLRAAQSTPALQSAG